MCFDSTSQIDSGQPNLNQIIYLCSARLFVYLFLCIYLFMYLVSYLVSKRTNSASLLIVFESSIWDCRPGEWDWSGLVVVYLMAWTATPLGLSHWTWAFNILGWVSGAWFAGRNKQSCFQPDRGAFLVCPPHCGRHFLITSAATNQHHTRHLSGFLNFSDKELPV